MVESRGGGSESFGNLRNRRAKGTYRATVQLGIPGRLQKMKMAVEAVPAQPGLFELHLTGPGWVRGPALNLSQRPGYGLDQAQVACLTA